MAAPTPKLTLYTNHACPWAHRAHIALSELGIPYTESIIDLSVPRTPAYLSLNPRGLVPALAIDDGITTKPVVITESAIVANYLADAFPSRGLLPKSDAPDGALMRARIAFFVDTYISKIPFLPLIKARTEEERAEIVGRTVDVIVNELEPLLGDAAPFFGGSGRITQAEVLTGSFVIRLMKWPHYGAFPPSLLPEIQSKAPVFTRWAEAVSAHPSVAAIFDAEGTAEMIVRKFGGR